jgi:hypothetical protein
MLANEEECRLHDAAVGKNLTAVVEQHDPVAQSVPPLLRVADNDLRPPSTTVVRWWALRLVLAHHNQLLVRSRRSLAGPAVTVCVPGSPGGPGRDTGELRIHIPNYRRVRTYYIETIYPAK